MIKYFLSKNYWQVALLLTEVSIIRFNKNSFLGSSWGLVQPFIYVVIVAYFFGFLLKVPSKSLVINLAGALPFWTFLVSSLNIACNSLISRETIIKKIIISKTVFPIADSLVQVYTLVYSFVAMYVAMVLFYPSSFSYQIIFLPLIVLPLIVSVLSCSIGVAFLTPYIRDIPQMLNVLFSVLYWTIPIVYPYSIVPESKKIFFEINPIFLLIRPIQILVMEGKFPEIQLIAKACFVTVFSVIINYLIYRQLSKNVVYYL